MYKEKQPDIPRFSSKEEIETCHCCKKELTEEEDYDNYGGLCTFCYPGLPADYDPENVEKNSCDCCRAGRQY